MVHVPGPNYYEEYMSYKNAKPILSRLRREPISIVNSSLIYIGYSLLSAYYYKLPSQSLIQFISDFEEKMIKTGIVIFAGPVKNDRIGIYFVARDREDDKTIFISKIEEKLNNHYSSFFLRWIFI